MILYIVVSVQSKLPKSLVIGNVLDAPIEQASAISVLTSTVVCKPQLILVGGPAERHIELAVSEDLRV